MDAPTPVDPSVDGPLSREQAAALLDLGARRLDEGAVQEAARAYRRVVGHRDPDLTAAALLGLGEAFHRFGAESEAIDAWSSVLAGPETPSTYPAWRNLAAARVRAGNLGGALDAYREAERRAPPEDKAEIAARLGWVSKELGDTSGSRRWFARARAGETPWLTYAIIAITAAVSISAWLGIEFGVDFYSPLELDKAAVADGEYWRLWTAALLHAPPAFGYLHLFFNMYALWLAGPIVERFYGRPTFGFMYLVLAAAGSVASFVFGSDAPSVGASGAIFGLFGVLIAATRFHDPTVDTRTRTILIQLGPLVVINLVFGFLSSETIDNAAHIGGLVAGLWLGWILVPGRVARRTADPTTVGRAEGWRSSPLLPAAGVLALIVVLLVGLAVGTRARGGSGPDGILAIDTGDASVGSTAP